MGDNRPLELKNADSSRMKLTRPPRALRISLAALVVLAAGCTTDQQFITNQRKTRMEGVTLYNRADYDNAAGAFRNAVKSDPRATGSKFIA